MFTGIRFFGSQIIPRIPVTLAGFFSQGSHAIAVRSGQLSAFSHLSFEQALFERISKIQREALAQGIQVLKDATPAISFSRTNSAPGFVVIGQNQFAQRECNLAKMAEDGVRLVRRKTGGGAVFIDHGNVMFTVIRNAKTHPDLNDGSFFDILIKAINDTFNVKAYRSGGKQNDVYVGDKKVAGVAFGIDGDVRLFHTCVLVSACMGKLKDYLVVDLEKLKSKGIVESNRQMVTNLNEFDKEKTCEDLSDNLQKEFSNICPSPAEFHVDEKGILNIPEARKISESMQDKNYLLRAPQQYTHKLEKRFRWGYVYLTIDVKEGKIGAITVNTDALDTGLPTAIMKAIQGEATSFSPEVDDVIREVKTEWKDLCLPDGRSDP